MLVETTLTDEQLARNVQMGDVDIFAELVGRFEAKLLRYGRKFLSGREDIEDIVQEVFISAYEHIQEYDPGRPFSSWIYRIAHNNFVNALRKKSRNPVRFFGFELDTVIPHSSHAPEREPESVQLEMRTLIEKGLSKISDSYAEILILYYLEDFSYQEIADILRIPAGTVGVRLQRARVALKKNALELHDAYE
ncbi:MAG: sigW [Parcubacteria group bacterium]|nr:sigW [Parcubacteria group bacterium]